jgi:hypothetical protein
MALITDVDLLRIEPTLFTDTADVATVLHEATDGSLTGTTLTSPGSDFAARDVGAGRVAVLKGEPVEVVSRQGATQLTVSRPRPDDEAPLIDPTAGSALSITVPTFDRQIARIEAWLLASLGFDTTGVGLGVDPAAILNPDDLGRLIALETITRVLQAAAALDPTDESLKLRADVYLAERAAARLSTEVILDLDGDGTADATRRVNVVAMARQ